MHRRGLQCLLEATGTNTLICRPQAAALHSAVPFPEAPAQRHGSKPLSVAHETKKPRPQEWSPKKKSRQQEWSPKHKKQDSLSQLTTKIIHAAVGTPRKVGWTPKDHAAEEGWLRKLAVPITQSIEVENFLAQDTDVVATEIEDDQSASELIQPGMFVELRRNNNALHAVVLAKTFDVGMHVVISMTHSGNVVHHRAQDIVFTIPGFADKALIARCGHNLSREAASNEHQVVARAEVLRRMNELQKQVDAISYDVASKTAHVLRQLTPADPEQWWTVSVPDVVKRISDGRNPSVATVFCVHKYLMQKHRQFVAPATSFLTTHAFWARPKSIVDNIQHVESMVAKRDPRIFSFLEKAKKLIFSQSASTSMTSGVTVEPRTDVTFTEDDQAIIRFLKGYLGLRRSTQKDPYELTCVTFLRWTGLYSDKVIKQDLVQSFLIQIGALSPWSELSQIGGDLESRSINATLPDSGIVVPQKPGPDELYSEDIVAHLRHDFGNMPVYVIDDVSAEELDDGLSVERSTTSPGSYWVHVHIADPTSLLHPGHTLSKEARELVCSRYLLSGVQPMLPFSLVHQGLSLRTGGQPQKTMTFSFMLNQSGEIVDYAVRAGIIRNTHVLTYAQVDQALGVPVDNYEYPFGRPPSHAVHSPALPKLDSNHIDDLRALNEVRELLTQWSIRQNIIVSLIKSPQLSLSPSTASLPSTADDDPTLYGSDFPLIYAVAGGLGTTSHRLVAEAMKGACRVASKFFRDRNVPALRRAGGPIQVHDSATMSRLLAKRDVYGEIQVQDFYKENVAYESGYHTLELKGHWQLGIPDGEGYVRVTSPLRRYADMVHHWQAKYALLGTKQPCFSREWLSLFGSVLSAQEKDVSTAGKAHINFWALKYIEHFSQNPRLVDGRNPLDEFDAVVMSAGRIDSMTGARQSRVYVPSLGVIALSMDTFGVSPGTQFKARYHGIKMGVRPVLLIKPLSDTLGDVSPAR